LWDRSGHRYLLDQLLADTGSGHNITHSVFVECGSMYMSRRVKTLNRVCGVPPRPWQ
jgi:hypothetical protein